MSIFGMLLVLTPLAEAHRAIQYIHTRSLVLINRHTYAYGIWEGIGCVLVYLQRGATQNTTDTAKKGGELIITYIGVGAQRFQL